MRSRFNVLTLAVLLCVGFTSCGYSNLEESPEALMLTASAEPEYRHASEQIEMASDKAGGRAIDAVAMNALMMGAVGQSDVRRYIIQNASMRVEVDDPEMEAAAIRAFVLNQGGYVGNMSNQPIHTGGRSIHLTVRVPSNNFEATMDNIEQLGKILGSQITTNDVTEEYVDTSSRIRNLERTEERVLAHLERTGDLEDIIAVERELGRIRGQIEQATGRIRYLDHRIDYSTIDVALVQTPSAATIAPASTFSSGKVAQDAWQSLTRFLQFAWTQIIWLGVWAVVWLPTIAVMWMVARRARLAAAIKGM